MLRSDNGTAYQLSGPDHAPVVVLIHGLGLNHQTWRHYAVLSKHYRVLNYDLYGHGDSAPPPETPSLTLFATQLQELLDVLNIDRCALIGFSLGGMINRRFAMNHPQRTTALIILNSPHERSAEAQALVEAQAKNADDGPAANIETTLKRWFSPDFQAKQPDSIAEIRAWVLGNEPVCYRHCRQVLATGVIELIRPQPPITIATLVVTCENDSGSTPAMAHAIAAEIIAAKTLVIPQLQHMGLIEQPQLFVEPMMDFLHAVLTKKSAPVPVPPTPKKDRDFSP